MPWFSLVATVLLALLLIVLGDAATLKEPFDCDPCIDRPSYLIRAIVHGTKSAFWEQVRNAAFQAAADMRVNFQMELYDTFDEEKMAQDIIDLSTGPNAPDALIVSIPSTRVQEAVSTALKYVPVFGLNSGYEVASELGLFGFVSMDEYEGGAMAAREFSKQKNVTNATQFLFVNHEKGNLALQHRLNGFQDTLDGKVEELVVDPDGDMASLLKDALEGCNYDAVLLASSFTLEYTTSAMSQNGCSLGDILLGTFDTNANVYGAIAVGKLSFAISQHQHLQGAFSVVMASLYATTGKKLVPSSESLFGVYSSGPSVINLRNLPSDTLQTCEDEAFPVCSDTKSDLQGGVSQSKCGCAERPKIKIAGVTHAAETDFFWDVVYSAAFQAADDMDIDLKLDRLVLENEDQAPIKMAKKIVAYCQEGVDGLFVTITSEDVIPAITYCLGLNVPVLSINAGFDTAKNLTLMHHIAQPEYTAGWGAGNEMIEAGMTIGYCLPHAKNISAVIERCQGFEDAIAEARNVTYGGTVNVPPDSMALFKTVVEDAIGEDGDWPGVGILLHGRTIDDAINLHSYHPEMLIGSFDTSETLYDGLENHIFLFGIDQEQYLQGYLPVVLLTWNAYTKQKLETFSIETGPRFVKAGPAPEKQICEHNIFMVCPEPEEFNLNQLTKVRPVGLAFAVIVWVTSIAFSGWVIWNRKLRVVMASQPPFLLMICTGTFVMALTVIPLSIDDGIASDEGCDKACMTTPWLFALVSSVFFCDSQYVQSTILLTHPSVNISLLSCRALRLHSPRCLARFGASTSLWSVLKDFVGSRFRSGMSSFLLRSY
jgi:simple sugar transport system substrate-binding protein